LFILSSCSVNNILVHYPSKTQKAPLKTKSNFLTERNFELNKESLLYTSVNNNIIEEEIKLDLNLGNTQIDNDSIKIITKSGREYEGILVNKTTDGYFIQIKNNQKIYISNLEIKEIKFIRSDDIKIEESEENIEIKNPQQTNYYKKDSDNSIPDFQKKIEPDALKSFLSATMSLLSLLILTILTSFNYGFEINIIFIVLSLILSSFGIQLSKRSLNTLKLFPNKYKKISSYLAENGGYAAKAALFLALLGGIIVLLSL